jgi:hypothetical protein
MNYWWITHKLLMDYENETMDYPQITGGLPTNH